jgi:pteridine reductase
MLQDKTILITGSAKRIGREIALYLAKQGFNIALHYNHSKDEALNLSEELKKLAVGVRLYQGDLSDNIFTEQLIDAVYKDFPDLYGLINNAAIFKRAQLSEINQSLFTQMLQVNHQAAVILTQRFLKLIKTGKVVNINDKMIDKDLDNYLPYILSKRALKQYSDNAKNIYGKDRLFEVYPTYLIANLVEDPKKFQDNIDLTGNQERIAQLLDDIKNFLI